MFILTVSPSYIRMASETIYWCVSLDNGIGAARAMHLHIEPKTVLYLMALNLSNKSTQGYFGRLAPAIELLATTFRVLLSDTEQQATITFPLENLQYRVAMRLFESGRYDSYTDDEVASEIAKRPLRVATMQTILENLCSDLGVAYLYGSGGMEIQSSLFDYRVKRYEKALSAIPFPVKYNKLHICVLYFSIRDVPSVGSNFDYSPLDLP